MPWTIDDASRPPIPRPDAAETVVPAPRDGEGCWAGAPSVARDADGTLVIAYRIRDVDRDVARTEIARSDDGLHLTTVATIDRHRFGAFSMERPAIVRLDDGRWRLYVSLASGEWPASKHWWIEALDADDPESLPTASSTIAFAGDERTAVKDPVIRRGRDGWIAWICCHPLEERDEEDRMATAAATSDDGITWRWSGEVLRGRAGAWDARGTRLTCVFPNGSATYDGRASKEENFHERTGMARPGPDGGFVGVDDGPVADVRYLEALPLDDGTYRLWYETPLPDGSHEIRTEWLAPPESGRVSGRG